MIGTIIPNVKSINIDILPFFAVIRLHACSWHVCTGYFLDYHFQLELFMLWLGFFWFLPPQQVCQSSSLSLGLINGLILKSTPAYLRVVSRSVLARALSKFLISFMAANELKLIARCASAQPFQRWRQRWRWRWSFRDWVSWSLGRLVAVTIKGFYALRG